MELSESFRENFQNEIRRLRESGVDISGKKKRYILELGPRYKDGDIEEIGKYGKIRKKLGSIISVDVPMDNVIELLTKDYIINADYVKVEVETEAHKLQAIA